MSPVKTLAQSSTSTRVIRQTKKVPRVVAVIDLTLDEPSDHLDMEVIDLTGDSDEDQDQSKKPAVFRFPFKKLPVEELVVVLDSLRSEFDEACLNSVLDLFDKKPPRASRQHLRRSTVASSPHLSTTTAPTLSKLDSLKVAIKSKFFQTDAETPITEFLNNPVTPDLLTSMIRTSSWLSDETINAFTATLQIAYPRVKFFNTFFYSVLSGEGNRGGVAKSKTGYNYQGVRRWTKKQKLAGIFEFDRVVVPINKGNTHWCFAYICLREFLLGFLDSIAGSTIYGKRVLENLKRYLHDEWQDKVASKNLQMNAPHIPDINTFQLIEHVGGCPQQSDGSSCGVFVCYYSYCIARGDDVVEFKFVQDDADVFRKRIAYVLVLPVLIELDAAQDR
ncbi:UNVERIFIED_CONTAM: hypothetical protein HDU68_002667 [Siphonaria sp. JEL0065]|nr:hypothetical protein HDU68_002667 [Siphonaria sp. JEL0065]